MEAVATATRRPLDGYFTPEALAADLLRRLTRDGFWRGGRFLEPSAGKGAFVRAANMHLEPSILHANDIDPERRAELFENERCDKLTAFDFLEMPTAEFELIAGNPPFNSAEQHVRKALSIRARFGAVAFLLRLAFLESQDRIPFWREHPASKIYVLSERPSFTGRGTDNCAYGFFVWAAGHRGPTELEVISWR